VVGHAGGGCALEAEGPVSVGGLHSRRPVASRGGWEGVGVCGVDKKVVGAIATVAS
jgi:hypothetical protein